MAQQLLNNGDLYGDFRNKLNSNFSELFGAIAQPIQITLGQVTGLDVALAAKQPIGSYLTAETDPVFSASAAAGILAGHITNWNTAYSWGNHASFGYVGADDITLALSNAIGTVVQPYDANTVVDAAYVHTDENFTTLLKTKLDGLSESGGPGPAASAEVTTLNVATVALGYAEIVVASVGMTTAALIKAELAGSLDAENDVETLADDNMRVFAIPEVDQIRFVLTGALPFVGDFKVIYEVFS